MELFHSFKSLVPGVIIAAANAFQYSFAVDIDKLYLLISFTVYIIGHYNLSVRVTI